MKRLNDLKKSLPSNARLSNMEHTRVKGGNGDKRTGDDNQGKGDRPSITGILDSILP